MRHDRATEEEIGDAIDLLCRQFCDPDGPLSPRRINLNPNLVFTIAVDPHSPTDEKLLRSFIKHGASHAPVSHSLNGHGSTAASTRWPGPWKTLFDLWTRFAWVSLS
jgi:hypothetical protein